VSAYRQQIAAALECITTHSSRSSSWCGRRYDVLSARRAAELPAATARAVAIASLERVLYERFYCPGRAVPFRPGEPDLPPPRDPAFVSRLSRANAGTGSWDAGWRVDAADVDGLVVSMNGLRMRVQASQCRGAGAAPAIGTEVAVRVPKELAAASPGFYTTVGDIELGLRDGEPVLRVYWNVPPAAAAGLVAALTSRLNPACVPFRLKVLDAPAAYGRCDTAVLFLRAADFPRSRKLLREVAAVLARELRTGAPAFTKPVSRGVAMAEEPRTPESFGESRCRLLAEGVMAAHERSAQGHASRFAVVVSHFADAGVDPDRPYLEASRVDRYRW
jgi:hypothetical protein